jgi:hypothetical protein
VSDPTSRFVSPGRFLVEQISRTSALRLNHLQFQRMDFSRRPRVSRSHRPLRQIRLCNGDQLLAEVVQGTETTIELRWRSNPPITVSRDFIAGICNPPGEIELLTEDFEQAAVPVRFVDPHAWSRLKVDDRHSVSGESSCHLTADAEPLAISFPEPLDAARIQFWIRLDETTSARNMNGAVARVFFDVESTESGMRNSWQLEIGRDRTSLLVPDGTDSPEGTQSVATGAGWHCVTVSLSPQRELWLLDDALLRSGRHLRGRLRAVRISTGTACWIDDVLISQMKETPFTTSPTTVSTNDSVTLPTGDQWFGRVRRLSREGVLFSGLGEDRSLQWSDVSRVEFSQPDHTVRGIASSPSGLVASIEFQSNVDRPRVESDRLKATITAATTETLSVWHPALGNLLFAWRDVARIEPLFLGSSIQIDARRMHLGDAIREDFHRPIPDGTEWKGEFEVSAIPAGRAWLSLSVADVEPSGPDTPPGSPFLRELRDGRMRTELTINDRPVTDLNRWLRFRAPLDRPERLRIPIPAGLIQSGRNTFRLSQHPRQTNGTEYDNCELSDLQLEFGEPSSASPR